jgi:hypothetical protein
MTYLFNLVGNGMEYVQHLIVCLDALPGDHFYLPPS